MVIRLILVNNHTETYKCLRLLSCTYFIIRTNFISFPIFEVIE